ncbi:FAD-dependent oxidoreductase [Sphingobacterium multivorum]|uniref:FAD-dependent oxidoreductase n=1 Tax=Sphingobacterium multivorum TaxID=28454 RepID=UPI0028ACDAF2|nr:FAD-dependent oxidoreductase [Sphingobacterium multivorum]
MKKFKFYTKLIWGLILSLGMLYSCDKKAPLEPSNPVLEIPFENVSGVVTVDLKKTYDVVVYGGTSAAIIAAMEVVNSGKSVILINPPGGGLGGMSTNGLGCTDVLHPEILGGLTRQFYQDIKIYYSDPLNWFQGSAANFARYTINGDIMLWFEPKAAKSVFKGYIEKLKIPILHGQRLNLNKLIQKNSDNAIVFLEMESGLKVNGKMFIDASYEGDIMAKSGVKYTVGRESNSLYGEYSNGIQRIGNWSRNEMPDNINTNSNKIQKSLSKNGTGDSKIQAYCFRMCLTNIPYNRIPIEKPVGYDEKEYELLFEYLKVYKDVPFFDLNLMPNGKTDSNNSGPFSTDYVGENYNYPEASHVERENIVDKHKRYQMGLLWTLANHPNVPEYLRLKYSEWGLPKDEFLNNNHWPKQLYIREGRRMVSDYIMTELNCVGRRTSQQSIGRADYPMDSHIVQRYYDEKGFVKNEGQLMVGVKNPYPIDYRSIIPSKKDCTNLFVPICLSASHIAYGSIRMEPVFMNLGQSSAVAAILAINKRLDVQSVNYEELASELLKRRIVL